MPLFLLAGHAAQAHQHPTDAQVNDGDVITVTAPLYSPLTIVTSPKTPRQPVPASDGSDYLKTIPGFRRSATAAPTAIRCSAACSVRG